MPGNVSSLATLTYKLCDQLPDFRFAFAGDPRLLYCRDLPSNPSGGSSA